MFIDNKRDYEVLSYKFRNLINLSLEEKLMVLEERNHPKVKRWMFNNRDITEAEHLRFIQSLANRADAFYWLVELDGKPIGVLNIVHCDYDKNEGEAGYYLFASVQDSGIGLEFQYAYKKFFFEILGVDNLPGHILYGNTSAYYISAFYGGGEDGIAIIDGRKFLLMHTSKEAFMSGDYSNITSNFVKFIKKHPKKWD